MKKENFKKMLKEMNEEFKPFNTIPSKSFIKVGSVVVKTKLPIFFESHEASLVDNSENQKIYKINRFNTDVYFYEHQIEKSEYGFK